MGDWGLINTQIRRCKRGPNPIFCLQKLFDDTGDGFVAYNLALEHEKSGDYPTALHYYEETFERFPRQKYKRMAQEKKMEMERKIGKEIKYEITPKEVENNCLFIVTCTKIKIWQEKPSIQKYVQAKKAYRGESFLNWLESEESRKHHWLILSAKYGFIEPDHPIHDYDVSFNNEKSGPISNETPINQVLAQKRLGKQLTDFKTIYVVGSETYFNKVKIAFSGTNAEVILYQLLESSKESSSGKMKFNLKPLNSSPRLSSKGNANWKDLFSFLKKVLIQNPCDGTLKYTEIFCYQTNMNFEYVKERLIKEGGYCDCEVLMNAQEGINPEEIMSPPLTKEQKMRYIATDIAYKLLRGDIPHKKTLLKI